MAVLVRVNGALPGQIIELTEEETVIGRLPDCAIVLDRQGVSRRHVSIRRQADGFYLSDLCSRNFTFLNHRQLAPEQGNKLKQGDRITICDVELVFYTEPPKAQIQDPENDLIVTEGADESTIHTLDASRSDLVLTVRPELKLKAILEITRNLSSTLQVDTAAPKILDTLLDIFPQAERSFLVLLRDSGEKPSIRQIFHRIRPLRKGQSRTALGRPPGDESRMSISRTIMKCVLDQRKAVLSQNADSDPNLPTSASIADLRIRSFMCAPLLTPAGQALGILQLDTTSRDRFNQDDLDLLVAVAGQAGIAVQNASLYESMLARERIERDLRLAEQVQRRFLPQSVPEFPGYGFFAHYRAAFEVGGDYYDFVPLPENRLAIALGDVSGKGVAAALMMAKFSGDARYSILTQGEPGAAADRLNDLLNNAGFEERFITMCLGVLDISSRTFRFCSAGHPPILIRRASGEIEEHGGEISGFPLGILPTTGYGQAEVELGKGDVVVLYSDGITDGRNARQELYDSTENPRLKRRIAGCGGGPEAVGRSILQEVREYTEGQPQADDLTLVCFGPLADGVSPARSGLLPSP